MVSDLVLSGVAMKLGGRALLFSHARQQVFELNETACAIWAELQAGLPRTSSLGELSASRRWSDHDREIVETAVDAWRELGLIENVADRDERLRREAASRCAAPRRSASMIGDGSVLERPLVVAGVRIDLRFSHRALERRCAVLSATFRAPDDAPAAAVIRIVARNDSVQLFIDGVPGARVRPAAFVPALKAALVSVVLERGDYALALHAAALVREGRATLLSGPPGAGKTTLATALSGRAGVMACDDLVLLQNDGRVLPVAFPAAVKSGAWALAEAFEPRLAALPEHLRPDGVRVRYLPVRALAGSFPVERLVLLNRAGKGPSLEAADPVAALDGLLRGAYTPDRRLDADGFAALVIMLRGAECLRLSGAPLDEAVRLLSRAADCGTP